MTNGDPKIRESAADFLKRSDTYLERDNEDMPENLRAKKDHHKDEKKKSHHNKETKDSHKDHHHGNHQSGKKDHGKENPREEDCRKEHEKHEGKKDQDKDDHNKQRTGDINEKNTQNGGRAEVQPQSTTMDQAASSTHRGSTQGDISNDFSPKRSSNSRPLGLLVDTMARFRLEILINHLSRLRHWLKRCLDPIFKVLREWLPFP
jgi:hypothetical protein